MAKCPVCDSRKGKRQCAISNGLVCSVCCGTIRKEELCLTCSYYQKPKRKYNEVPSYTASQMAAHDQLNDYSNAIEGALCAYDIENNKSLTDADAIRIIEMLMDKYYFKGVQINADNPFLLAGFNFVDAVIGEDLADIDELVLVKILGVIYFVAKRRTKVGREYMTIIHQYVGQRIGSGIRVMSRL
ncbi:MAG: hypothetical protein QX196_05450 [Methylococcaceae bacterium]